MIRGANVDFKRGQRSATGFDMVDSMTFPKAPLPPAVHLCPVCHHVQTKIQRVLSNDKHGSTNYVCARIDCALGIDLKKVATWIAR
jgi:hypothetical protein